MPEMLSDPFVKYYLSALIGIYPLQRIFRRAGFAPFHAAVLLVPFLGYVIAAGMLALRKWPVLSVDAPADAKARA